MIRIYIYSFLIQWSNYRELSKLSVLNSIVRYKDHVCTSFAEFCFLGVFIVHILIGTFSESTVTYEEYVFRHATILSKDHA